MTPSDHGPKKRFIIGHSIAIGGVKAQLPNLLLTRLGGIGVTVIRIEDSNHYIQLDQPERFVAAVEAFMRR